MMADRTDEFIVEAREHLSVVEDCLLQLERQPDSPQSPSKVDRCFRAIHSVKGDAGFLGFQKIRDLAHAMETVLGEIQHPVSPPTVESLLIARDRIATFVDDPNRSNSADIGDLIERLSGGTAQQHQVHIDLDLSEWNAGHPGGIASLVRRLAAEGQITAGQLHVGSSNVRTGLPVPPTRWTAQLKSSRSANEILELIRKPHDKPTVKLSADLSQWSRQLGGLAGRFRELLQEVNVTSGRVIFANVDLRSRLPADPVLWSGDCRTAGPLDELSRRFQITFPQIERPEDLASRPATTTPEQPVIPAVGSTATSTSNRPVTTTVHGETEKSTTLRIQVELLDRLMTLVGELTLVRNQSLLAFADQDGSQRAIIQRLNSVTSELQDATLRARMQPVGNLFNKFPRMVRDLARQLGKEVEIELQGREVELDKTILEQLSDPLMHLVRNSVDHGIEMPDVRVTAGKPRMGRIVLSAIHEDGQVHIQIRDDGKGIEPQAVKAKALALGLKTDPELSRMSAKELFSLILLPGFSTATRVTEVSGRGVGMDVVRTNIEQLEGTLSIDSVPGVGCSMMLRLPLTLAIIPCLIVSVDSDRFAVPQRELEEVVCLHPEGKGRIEQAFDTEVFRLREKLIPVVRFHDVLERMQPFTDETKAQLLASRSDQDSNHTIQYLLVLRLAGRRYGLVVDDVRGTQEVVVKPMHPSMKRVDIFAGATIMGDGRVTLIADSEGIVEHARLSFDSGLEQPDSGPVVRDAAQAHRVLIFEYGPDERFALPLLQIRRIEIISRERIESAGGHEFVIVDGVATRILRLNIVLKASAPASDDASMSMILPKYVPQPMGILVSQIIDTESLALDLHQDPDQDRAILGTAIVRDRLTQFLDIHRLAEKLFGIMPSPSVSTRSNRRSQRLLLIDDTAFFREVIKRYLEPEGYQISTAIHGQDGLNQLDAKGPFDLIVSDIEMPVMDGWQFAREVRRRGITTPMLALTSLSGANYETKAKECGYDSYEVKLDHERLVRRVGHMLAEKTLPG